MAYPTYVYRLDQNTWNDRGMGEFNLPRTLGHFDGEQAAIKARDEDIKSRFGHTEDEGWTTEADYSITKIGVVGYEE